MLLPTKWMKADLRSLLALRCQVIAVFTDRVFELGHDYLWCPCVKPETEQLRLSRSWLAQCPADTKTVDLVTDAWQPLNDYHHIIITNIINRSIIITITMTLTVSIHSYFFHNLVYGLLRFWYKASKTTDSFNINYGVHTSFVAFCEL